MPRRFWIVCLMLALLPLRGWAAASMTVPAAAVDLAAQIGQTADEGSPTQPSCHEAADGKSTPSGHACSLCDLCHAAVADLGDASVPQMPLPAVTPLPVVARDTGRRAVGGLDRPPRPSLA